MKRLGIIFFVLLAVGCQSTQDVEFARLFEQQQRGVQAEQSLVAMSDAGYLKATAFLTRLYTNSEDPQKQQLAREYYQQLDQDTSNADYARQYVKWIAEVSREHPSYTQTSYSTLWSRQTLHLDVADELVKFYGWHPQQYDISSLERFYDEWKTSWKKEERQDALMYLNLVTDPSVYVADIDLLCQKRGSQEDTSDRATCHQLYLKLAKQAQDINAIDKRIEEIVADYQRGDITEDGVVRCSRTLIDYSYGGSYLAKGMRLAGVDFSSDKLFLFAARYEMKEEVLMSEQELLSGLTARAAEGNQEATLILGLLYMRGDRVPEDPERAESYLKLVLEGPRAQHNLGLLYLSAKLGEEKMQDGIDLLLASARGGDGQSYIELAKAFYDTAGITPNYSYVWIFANMALEFAEFKDQQQRETIESWIKESGSQRAQAISTRLLEIERREVRWSLALM